MQNLQNILLMLNCPECQVDSNLSLADAHASENDQWGRLLPNEQQFKHKLVCQLCSRIYPITIDNIPILWSDALQQSFDLNSRCKIDDRDPKEIDVKAANIQVYESTVSDYSEAGIHADYYTQQRFLMTLNKINFNSSGWHIDIGCGGGNILQMANSAGFKSQIGTDISLTALRLVMEKKFHVVLGDAEKLPFKSSKANLITASSTLHHLYQPLRLITEAARILHQGGAFYTDFDPNALAAEWGWLMKNAYTMRKPIYRWMSKVIRKRVGHKTQNIQRLNDLAEFHNGPGFGFMPDEVSHMLTSSDFTVQLMFLHNTRDSRVTQTTYVKPSIRHFIVQILSGRNPFLRRNSDTIMTFSFKN